MDSELKKHKHRIFRATMGPVNQQSSHQSSLGCESGWRRSRFQEIAFIGVSYFKRTTFSFT